MKIFVLIALVLPIIGVAQGRFKKIETPAELDSISYALSTKEFISGAVSLPFKKIKIIDARFDTTKIGFELHQMSARFDKYDFKKIRLEGSVAGAIQLFYNDYYSRYFNNKEDELLIVLKTLWIDNFPAKRYYVKKRYEMVNESYQDIYVKMEFYLQKGSNYYPIRRLDTVFQLTDLNNISEKIIFNRRGVAYLLKILRSVIEEYDFNPIVNKAEEKRKFRLTQIDSFNNKRFLLPILQDAVKIGGFTNFNEFSNNSPSVKADTIISVKDKKNVTWIGFSSHERLLFRAIGNGIQEGISTHIYSLQRIGNTYDFFSSDNIYFPKSTAGNVLRMIDRNSINFGNNARQDGAYLNNAEIPRQLNMETGEIY